MHGQTGKHRDVAVNFKALADQIHIVPYLSSLSRSEGISYVSPQIVGMLGYPEDAWIANPDFWMEHVHPEDRQRVLASLDQTWASGTPFDLEYRLLAQDGRVVWVRDRAAILPGELGGPSHLQGFIVDVSLRKATEARLRDSEESYRILFEESPVSLSVKDFSEVIAALEQLRGQGVDDLRQYFDDHPDELGRILTLAKTLDVNKATLTMFKGESKEDFLSSTFPFIGREGIDTYKASLLAMTEGKTEFEGEAVNTTLTGEKIHTNVKWTVVPGHERTYDRVLVTKGDITKHVKIEQEKALLLENERRARQTAEALVEITTSLTSTLDPEQVLEAILNCLEKLISYDSVSVLLLEGDRLRLLAGKGLPNVEEVIGNLYPADDELFKEVRSAEKPVVIADVRQDKRFKAWGGTTYTRGWMAIPMKVNGEAIGMMTFDNRKPAAYDQIDALMAQAFSNHAAIAIQNARLFDQAQNRIRRLIAMRDIDMAITSSLDLQLTLNVLLDQVKKLLKVDAADILMLNPRVRLLESVASRGFQTDPIPQVRIPISAGHAARAVLERRIVHIDNIPENRGALARADLLANEGILAYYGVPLIAKGDVKGVLEIFHRSPLAPDPEWLDFLEVLGRQAAIAVDNASLFNDLQRSNLELNLAYDATLEGWVRALDLRDNDTGGHTQRVIGMTLRLGRRMGIGGSELAHVRRGALLHDIGKMGVPDAILRKNGPLTEGEWVEMRKHPAYAYEMLYPIQYLRPALAIPYNHHEKWDGTGYPRGLKGSDIPLAARVFAVVDVWDALLSDRPYRRAWSQKDALDYIREQSGKHFDPQVVEAFLHLVEEEGQDQFLPGQDY